MLILELYLLIDSGYFVVVYGFPVLKAKWDLGPTL